VTSSRTARRKTKYIHGKSILSKLGSLNLFNSLYFSAPHVLFDFVIFVLFCQKPFGRGPDRKPRKRGREHGNYKHGEGKGRGINKDKYAAWIEGVLQRSNFRCFVTGEKRASLLVCHHLNSWDSYPEQRYEISNGIAITKEIHRAFHKEYGSGKNMREQFERFLEEKYNIVHYPWQNENHEPTLSVEEIAACRASQQDRQKEEILLLIERRGHTLLSAKEGFYTKSPVEIYCPLHETVNQTTVKKYKYSKTGLPCCGWQAQSDKGTWKHVNDARKLLREAKQKEED
jgi:hypothetical protein